MKISSKTAGRLKEKRIIRFAAVLLCLVMAAAVLPGAGTEAKAEGKLIRVGWYESSFNRTDSFGRRSGYAFMDGTQTIEIFFWYATQEAADLTRRIMETIRENNS